MSISGALNAAANGLATTQTMARVTSGNVANASTPGYVRREAILVSVGPGQGGAVVGEIRREVDEALVRMARMESAKMSRQQAIHEGLRDYALYLGQPGDTTTLPEKFSVLNTSLTTLVNMPSSTGAQAATIYAAKDLAATVRGLSDTLGTVRADIDMEIRYEVKDLNQALYDLAALNQMRRDFKSGSLEAVEFSDTIDRVLDQISGIVDIRVTDTVDGWVNVYTTGGVALLEGDQVHDVTYNPGDITFFAGSQEITPGKPGIRGLEEGSLAGFAELKGEIVPRFQLQLDEYARGLIEAFESADASLAAGQPSLFTDNGSSFDPLALEGLAGRLRVNEAVDQGPGGSVWRMRDGMGASVEGDAADPTQIQAFIDSLSGAVGADPATGFGPGVTLADFSAELMNAQSVERARAERGFNAARSAAEVVQASRSNSEGVNLDEEMQKLLLIEQSFAANSKILTAVAGMLDTLLQSV